MSNRGWAIFFVMIVAAIVFDFSTNHGDAVIFVLRKLAVLVEWMAFWR